jgi:hypothetical protein
MYRIRFKREKKPVFGEQEPCGPAVFAAQQNNNNGADHKSNKCSNPTFPTTTDADALTATNYEAFDPPWIAALMLLPPPQGILPTEWEQRKGGVRRFVWGGWHAKAIELGWTLDELYGTPGNAWHIIEDVILGVDENTIRVMDPRTQFFAPIYRTESYWEIEKC